MKRSQVEFLDLFFNEGEQISVSDSKFSFHSVNRDEVESDNITLKAPKTKKNPTGYQKNVETKDIISVCMNPVNGWKRDENVTGFRSFLIELDDVPLAEQKRILDESGMPYSICVYSGNKSLHYGIVLERDLPDYNAWLLLAKWIHNILPDADQQNVSPTRGFRFPDNMRPDGLMKSQSLIEMKTRVDNEELYDWLVQHKDKKPTPVVYRDEDYEIPDSVKQYALTQLPVAILKTLQKLRDGNQEYRNKSWFNMACFLAKKGVIIEEAIRVFDAFFREESDFSRQEFIMAIQSGYRHIHKKDYDVKDSN